RNTTRFTHEATRSPRGSVRQYSYTVWEEALTPELRTAYLRRLGVNARSPSVDALQELHRRHVERVPYETMWIHAGEAWGIDPLDSAVRIALEDRGGYC